MKGAIFFGSKYGSTAEYAQWIGEATGLPVFNMKKSQPDPGQFDFLILGSPIMYHKLWNRKWFFKHWPNIKGKRIILFTVSGAPDRPKLDHWLGESLPLEMLLQMKHFALQGRQSPQKLNWFDRLALRFAAKYNKDPQASREELEGFDYMNKASIEPLVQLANQLKGNTTNPLLRYLVGMNN